MRIKRLERGFKPPIHLKIEFVDCHRSKRRKIVHDLSDNGTSRLAVPRKFHFNGHRQAIAVDAKQIQRPCIRKDLTRHHNERAVHRRLQQFDSLREYGLELAFIDEDGTAGGDDRATIADHDAHLLTPGIGPYRLEAAAVPSTQTRGRSA